MPNEECRYIIDSDEDMTYLFEQYDKAGIKNIDMFVEFLPIELEIAYLTLPLIRNEPKSILTHLQTLPNLQYVGDVQKENYEEAAKEVK